MAHGRTHWCQKQKIRAPAPLPNGSGVAPSSAIVSKRHVSPTTQSMAQTRRGITASAMRWPAENLGLDSLFTCFYSIAAGAETRLILRSLQHDDSRALLQSSAV